MGILNLCCLKVIFYLSHLFLNPFIPNVPFFYPLKTYFQEVKKECIGNEWVNILREIQKYFKKLVEKSLSGMGKNGIGNRLEFSLE